MADIYHEGETPVLDYAEAARTLAGLRHLGNDKAKTDTVARVSAAALLDIAVTLNAILNGFATGGIWPDDGSENDDEREVGPDGEPMGDPERDGSDDPDAPLDIDDRVELKAGVNGGPGGARGIITALGQSEGEGWAEIRWDVDENEASFVTRVWVDVLRREPVDETENGEPEGDDPDALEDGPVGPLTAAAIAEATAPKAAKIKKSKKEKNNG